MHRSQIVRWTASLVLLFGAVPGTAFCDCEVRPSSTPPPGPGTPPWFGGDGGGLVRLPASGVRGLYVLGISGASGTHVDRLGLSTMTSSGGAMPAAGEVGGPGGGAFVERCPDNYYATGIWGAAGLLVDSIGLICRDLATATNRHMTNLHGGMGGGPFVYECPSGYHLDGLNLRVGTYVDAIQATCAPD